MANSNKPNALGKGLSALLGEHPTSQNGFLPGLDIELIDTNPRQPRSTISNENVAELAESIKEHGIIEPLIVTKSGDRYTLVAGERRLKAATLAGLKIVPAIVKEASDQELLELALVENIQRKDLTAIEEANALYELHKTFGLKLDDLAKKVGRDISTVSNKMRLLKLPANIQQGILEGLIGEAHAYVLMSIKSVDAMIAAYNIVVRKEMSVSQTGELARKINLAHSEHYATGKRSNSVVYDDYTQRIEEKLKENLGKGVKLVRRKQGGKITIPFLSDTQLERLTNFLLSEGYLDVP